MFSQACVCSRGGGEGVPGPGGLVLGGVGIPACTEADPPERDGYSCGCYASYWKAFLFLFLLPATKFGQGNVFTSVCDSVLKEEGGGVHGRRVCVAGGACIAGGHAWQGGGHVWLWGHVWPGVCMAGGHAW